jgi:hypothetical protein
MVSNNHFVTASEIKAQLEETYPGLEAGEQTVRDDLARLGYAATATLPRRVPLLSERAKANQLQWAREQVRYNWH